MTRWDIDQTRHHVLRLFGDEQLELAKPCLRSVSDRLTYARIHIQDAKAKIDSYTQTVLQDTSLLAVTSEPEGWGEFNFFIREVGAYLTACVQSIHAVPDILAHTIYFCLGLNRASNTLKNRDICTATVLKLLKREPHFSHITSILDSLVRTATFAHLAALANQAKHRSIVFPTMSEDLTGTREKRHIVEFPAFADEDIQYPQIFADDFLAAEYERSSQCVVNTGNELNNVLQQLEP